MEHLAIDLGGRESQVCIRKENQEVIEERRLPTRSLKRYLQARPKSRVIMETCAKSFHIADQALKLGCTRAPRLANMSLDNLEKEIRT